MQSVYINKPHSHQDPEHEKKARPLRRYIRGQEHFKGNLDPTIWPGQRHQGYPTNNDKNKLSSQWGVSMWESQSKPFLITGNILEILKNSIYRDCISGTTNQR